MHDNIFGISAAVKQPEDLIPDFPVASVLGGAISLSDSLNHSTELQAEDLRCPWWWRVPALSLQGICAIETERFDSDQAF
jgi:hypothetical protein